MSRLEQAWFDGSRWPYLLWPLTCVFTGLAYRKKAHDLKQQWQPPIPLIVVGNISVGGTGKTPFTLALIEHLREQGYTPGVVSRGYKANPPSTPFRVSPGGVAEQCGDEPLMIVQRTNVPLFIDPDRVQACKALIEQTSCDIIISDDGLQHYRMGRTVEIAIIDGVRGLGNERCLPVGPLREPPNRLDDVDLIVVNGQGTATQKIVQEGAFTMRLVPNTLVSMFDSSYLDISRFSGQRIHAVAGIGNPRRFYESLKSQGCEVIEHSFADHHQYQQDDITFGDGLPVIMTEKDAVKCRVFGALSHTYFMPVDAVLPTALFEHLHNVLRDRTQPLTN